MDCCRVFGVAYLMQLRASNNGQADGPEKLVVKQIPFEGLDSPQIGDAIHEVKALKLLHHPNIVRYRGSWVTDNCGHVMDDPVTYWDRMNPTGQADPRMPPNATYVVPDALYIMTDYADGGSLDSMLKRNMIQLNQEGLLDEYLIQMWLAQLVLAIDHMHSCGVLHRDLKASALPRASKHARWAAHTSTG